MKRFPIIPALLVVLAGFVANAATTAPAPAAKPDGSRIVHTTKTGTKYHAAGCSYLKSDIPMTLDEAKKKGLTACSRCGGG